MRRKIVAYYTQRQVLQENIALSTSKSPLKPKLIIADLLRVAKPYVELQPKFKPFTKEDFCIAHTAEYVDLVFNFNKPGVMLKSNIPWSKELVKSLTYTSASLYNAIKHSLTNPEDLCFAPVSGMHHAVPFTGLGFCTFSGQVIASTKIYRETGKVGCYLDLDGHFGNSIEDSRQFVPDLNKAIPEWANFNPQGYNNIYVNNLQSYLYNILGRKIVDGDIDYVVWCHGADSHEDDDFGGQVDTEQWTKCSQIFWTWVKYMDTVLNRPLPVSFTLFGGYRKDDYQSVLNLHVSDIVTGINTLIPDANIDYTLKYSERSLKSKFR